MKAEEVVAQRVTLDGVVYNELLERIVSLTCPPGSMLYENVVAAEFGVSRTPVRRAFFQLARDGLLTVLPQRGARVSLLSSDKLREAQSVREILEISAFGDVARQWDGADPRFAQATREILACIAAQKEAVGRHDYLAFTGLDVQYHSLVLQLHGNATLLQVVNDMRTHLKRLRFLELEVAHHEVEAIGHHEEILRLLQAGDVAGTRAALRRHLRMLAPLRERLFTRHEGYFA